MSAALRIQLMLLARKNHFAKKPDLTDLTRHHHTQHPSSAVIEQPPAPCSEGMTSGGDPKNNGFTNGEWLQVLKSLGVGY